MLSRLQSMSISELKTLSKNAKNRLKIINKDWKTKSDRKCEVKNCLHFGKNVGENLDGSTKRAAKCSTHERKASSLRNKLIKIKEFKSNKSKMELYILDCLSQSKPR